MGEAYIGIPALTEAQRASELLHRRNIRCAVVRMPSLPGVRSCAFGLQLREEVLPAALQYLQERNCRVGRVLVRGRDGVLRERTG